MPISIDPIAEGGELNQLITGRDGPDNWTPSTEDVPMKRNSFTKKALLLLVIAGLLTSAGFCQTESATQNNVEERLQLLEQKLERLEQRINEALKDQRNFSTNAGSSDRELLNRFEAIDQKVRILERKRELEQEGALAQTKQSPALKAGPEGFSIRSADGNYQLKIRGHVQMDGRFFADDQRNLTRNTFVLRSVRPIFEGSLGKHFDFKLMTDFGSGQTVLQDMYLDSKIVPQLNIRAGKFKTPFGLERLQGEADTLFTERALPTGIAPNRDLGVQIFGEFWKGGLNYALGIFNGVLDGGSSDSDDNGGKDFAGRIFAQPFKSTKLSLVKDFGFGLAGTAGNRNGLAATPSVASYKTAGQNTFFRYISDGTSAGTVVGSGALYRISPQFYYYTGPFGMTGEYAISNQDVRKGATAATLQNTSWQISASYVLTGENASYKSVIPRKTEGHSIPGAFEIAGRYNELRIDPSAFPVFANPLNSARCAKAWGIGLNWYINRNLRFVMDYERTRFSGGASNGNRVTENALLGRVQVAY